MATKITQVVSSKNVLSLNETAADTRKFWSSPALRPLNMSQTNTEGAQTSDGAQVAS